MALTTTQHKPEFAISRILSGILHTTYKTLTRMSISRSRAQKLEYLRSLSDEELGERGLTREQAVYRVFADTAWT